MSLAVALPAQVIELIQQGALERSFHDGLYPKLLYRSEALWEEWPANTGEEVFISRPGLLEPVTQPLIPGTDPTPSEVPYEQWSAKLDQFADALDTHMPTATVSNANKFLRNIHQQGLQAGQSVNRISRNAMFRAYLGGHTVTIVAALAADTTIRVANLNGFLDVVTNITVRPVPVSPTAPLAITIPTIGARNVIGAVPDNPADPTGPGTLQLDAALGAGLAARNPVLADNRARVLRVGGGDSVDNIAAADTLTLQDLINATGVLDDNNIEPHEDGWWHAHLPPLGNTQVFSDEAFQRLNTALPEHDIYKRAFIGTLIGSMFLKNTESPNPRNTGAQVPTGPGASTSGTDIGAETVNDAGIRIGRVLITGKGILYERGLDESQYVTEAGITGKIGEFDVVNAGVQILTERIRLVLRAPVDRLQQKVGSAWSISTSFPVPTDVTAPTSPARYKRGVIIEYAEGTP
jgi:hypothetical protein